MPKETIRQGNPNDDQPFQLSVGWTRYCDVQLGIQVQDENDTLLNILYGGQLDQLEALGAALLDWLHSVQAVQLLEHPDFVTKDEQTTTHRELGAEVLDWVEKSRLYHPERDGIWANLTRFGINETIRYLRRARDAAYGRDE